MAEPAIKPMSVDEFLHWNDGTDTRYELIDGFPLAMAPPAAAHRMLAMRLGSRIEAVLEKRRACNAQGEAGILHPERSDTYFEADLAANCERHQFGQQALKEPFLIVEILSASTERHDRRVKLPAYRQIATAQEILLIASDGLYAELHRRSGAQWITEMLRSDAVLSLVSLPIEIRLADLYDGIAFDEMEV